MNFSTYISLSESFKPQRTYQIKQTEMDNRIIFDIITDELRNYRLTLIQDITNDGDVEVFTCKFGYANDTLSGVIQTLDDFYDSEILTHTLVEIFYSLYNQMYITPFKIIHKFQGGIDFAYKLLIVSIIEKELKDYYKTTHKINILSNYLEFKSYIPTGVADKV